MALVLHMAEHSEAGSNSYSGPGSTEYPLNATVEDKVNWLRDALAPESPLLVQQNALCGLQIEFGFGYSYSRIRRIAEAYGRESYSRAVYECFKRVLHDLDDYDRYIILRSVLPREDYLAVSLRDNFERNSLGLATNIICSRCTRSEIQGLKERYHSILGVQLEADIRRFTDGYHRQALVLLAHMGIQTPVARHGDIDVEMFDLDRVTKISGSLHQAFEQITYRSPQKNIMNNIVGLDKEYLNAVVRSYLTNYGRPLETYLMHEQHGHFEHTILALMKCSVNRPKYFAESYLTYRFEPLIPRLQNLSPYWDVLETLDIFEYNYVEKPLEHFPFHLSFGLERISSIFPVGSCKETFSVLHKAMRDPNGRADRDTIASVITTMAPRDMNMMKEVYLQEYGSTVEGDISLAFSDRQDCMEVLSLLLNSDSSN